MRDSNPPAGQISFHRESCSAAAEIVLSQPLFRPTVFHAPMLPGSLRKCSRQPNFPRKPGAMRKPYNKFSALSFPKSPLQWNESRTDKAVDSVCQFSVFQAIPNSNEDLRYNNPSRLMGISVKLVTPADAAFLMSFVEDPAEVKTLLKSPTAWGLSCGVSPTSLTNVNVKPLTTYLWLVTATITRSHDLLHDRGRRVTGRTGLSLEDKDSDSAYHPSEDESQFRGTKRGQWIIEEDDNLRRWKDLGNSWPWICDRFPERTDAAVRSRWFVVLVPRETLARTARA